MFSRRTNQSFKFCRQKYSVSNSFDEHRFWSLTCAVILEERRTRLRAKLLEMLTEQGKTIRGCRWNEARRGMYQYFPVRYSLIDLVNFPLSNIMTEIEWEVNGELGNESTLCTLASAKNGSDHYHSPMEYRQAILRMLTAMKGVAGTPVKFP